MKKTILFPLPYLLSATLTMGCAGLATKSRSEAEIQKIKKVAVVAYTATLPASATLSLDVGTGKTGASQGGSTLTANSAETERMLVDFTKALEKSQGWKTVDIQTMVKNPGYLEAYKKTMEGWQNKMPPGAGGTVDYVVPKVMDWNGPRILDFDGREKLMVDLGVNAIAMLKVNVTLKGFSVAGIGARKPVARAHIEVYHAGNPRPVWFETFEGSEPTEHVGMTAFIDEQKLQKLSLASVQSAYEKMNVKSE